jgi:hypothetical protein
MFTGEYGDQNSNCTYDKFPPNAEGGGGEEGDVYYDGENNILWSGYNNAYENLQAQLINASPEDIPVLQAQIENAEVGMGQCVLDAIQNISSIPESNRSAWINRMDPDIWRINQIIDFFNSSSFDSLSIYLNLLNTSGEDTEDRDNLKFASNWLHAAMIDGKNIYTLSNIDLEYLSGIAALTFGNYTAALRSFLNIYYNIRIDPPTQVNQYSRKAQEIRVNLQDIFIVPNPVDDSFSILNNQSPLQICNVVIFSIEGKVMLEQFYENTDKVCIKNNLKPGIYIIKVTQPSHEMKWVHKIVVN